MCLMRNYACDVMMPVQMWMWFMILRTRVPDGDPELRREDAMMCMMGRRCHDERMQMRRCTCDKLMPVQEWMCCVKCLMVNQSMTCQYRSGRGSWSA